jgi:hypothetical protein
VILPDGASHEINASLKPSGITALSTILRENTHHCNNPTAFLTHFSVLEEFKLRIYDLKVDILPISLHRFQEESELSYITLLQRVSIAAIHLTDLDIGV